MKIYLASSWRNKTYANFRAYLIREGFEVYDFKNKENQFHWSEIDSDWKHWSASQTIAHIISERKCEKAFNADFSAIKECDVVILLNPCGKSAHLEAGFAAGQGIPVLIYQHDGDPELMYRMADGIYSDTADIVQVLKTFNEFTRRDLMRKIFRMQYEPCTGMCYAPDQPFFQVMGELATDKPRLKKLMSQLLEVHTFLCGNENMKWAIDQHPRTGVYVGVLNHYGQTETYSGCNPLSLMEEMCAHAVEIVATKEWQEIYKASPGKGHDVCEHGKDHDLATFILTNAGICKKHEVPAFLTQLL